MVDGPSQGPSRGRAGGVRPPLRGGELVWAAAGRGGAAGSQLAPDPWFVDDRAELVRGCAGHGRAPRAPAPDG